jgi:hypothetical protein
MPDESRGDGNTLADKAIELVYGDRYEAYGHPSDVYSHVADLWSAYLGVKYRPVTVKDVALMMTLFKIGRGMERHSDDNVVDAHGYLLVYERILNRLAGKE